MSLLSIKDLSIHRNNCPVLEHIHLEVAAGEFVALIGPNGAGKTSLMRAALGLLPATGESNLASLSRAQLAMAASWLPQSREVAWPMSVRALITLGRQPYMGNRKPTADDEAAVDDALKLMELEALSERSATALSGGETARALMARCLAQNTPLLLADEPLAGLDMAHQLRVMDVLAARAKAGHAVLSSMHDIGLAARYCTRFVLVGNQRIIADGDPHDIINSDMFSSLFGVKTYFAQSDDGPIFMPTERLS